jgi:ornithine cyclodeaminase/alanine dehydrogenase-like protein (mu-crystallin family)
MSDGFGTDRFQIKRHLGFVAGPCANPRWQAVAMVRIVAESDICHLIDDRLVLSDAFKRIEKAIRDNEMNWVGAAEHRSVPLHGHGAISLLGQIVPEQGISLRAFPGDGTEAAPQNGSTWLLFDSCNGMLMAIFGAGLLSVMRTSIPSVACARVLSSSSCRAVAIIGGGRQAFGHCRIIQNAFPDVQQLLLWSPRAESRSRLAGEARHWFGGDIVNCATRDDATRAADLIFLLGPPNVHQIDPEFVKSKCVVVALGNSVPRSFEETATTYLPTENMMSQQQSHTHTHQTIAAALRKNSVPSGRKLIRLGGLYGWDIPIICWAYQNVLQAEAGSEVRLC